MSACFKSAISTALVLGDGATVSDDLFEGTISIQLTFLVFLFTNPYQ